EVLRQPVADPAVVETPLGQTLADASHELFALGGRTAVAQRDERPHVSAERPRPPAGVQRAADALVVPVLARPLGTQLEAVAVVQGLAVPHEPAARAVRVAARDAARHEPEAVAEVGGDPAVVPRCLPVPRPPRVVAQSVPVDRPFVVADPDRAPPGDQLLVVAAGELLAGTLTRLVRLAADHRRQPAIGEPHLAGLVRVVRERGARVGHLQRVVEHDELAVVGDRQLLERRDHLEVHPRRVELVVRVHLGTLEHEPDPAVGQVDAARHLSRPLVGAVRETEEPADAPSRVVDVEVHRLVEVDLRAQLVEVLVLRFEAYTHDAGPYASATAARRWSVSSSSGTRALSPLVEGITYAGRPPTPVG